MANTITRSITELVDLARRCGSTHTEIQTLLTAEWLKQSLGANGNNQCAAAQEIGVHRNTLARRMQKCGVRPAGKVRWISKGLRRKSAIDAIHERDPELREAEHGYQPPRRFSGWRGR